MKLLKKVDIEKLYNPDGVPITRGIENSGGCNDKEPPTSLVEYNV
jgi:hypothetical protein